jgi:hypothetical protein
MCKHEGYCIDFALLLVKLCLDKFNIHTAYFQSFDDASYPWGKTNHNQTKRDCIKAALQPTILESQKQVHN